MSIITIHSRGAGPSAHRAVLLLLAKARRAVNGWVAIYIARHEQRAMAWAMHMMNERQLRDVGVCPHADPRANELE